MSDLGDLPATHEAGRTDGEDDQDEKERDACWVVGPRARLTPARKPYDRGGPVAAATRD
jgi:hypothetical protein